MFSFTSFIIGIVSVLALSRAIQADTITSGSNLRVVPFIEVDEGVLPRCYGTLTNYTPDDYIAIHTTDDRTSMEDCGKTVQLTFKNKDGKEITQEFKFSEEGTEGAILISESSYKKLVLGDSSADASNLYTDIVWGDWKFV